MELAKMLELVKLTEDELIGGFITAKKGYYYTVLNRKDKNGKRKPKARVYRLESNILLT